jgi:peptide/nickel transport system ATP-binding protein
MRKLKDRLNTSMIMITHDLGVVAEICDQVAIMYAGTIIEFADKYELFRNPKHPYTIGLFGSIPDITKDEESLRPIKGLMPDPSDLPSGCPFHPRCDKAQQACSTIELKNVDIGDNHFVRCILYQQ